ncbi:MAG TPA: haloacid dehalogenase type II [Candidatus Lustribacter sp.]|jgi:2-haloacid dehalogenase|nr:haloacid dehalogenase type II [Candidatus Lustribacter sp.]
MKPAAVVFDLFGTLLDIASLRDAAASVTGDPSAFVTLWRDKQIAYSFASAIMGMHEDFDTITAHALRFAAEKFGVELDTLRRKRLIDAWFDMQPHDDALPALWELRERGIRCGVLTNGTPATAASAIANAGLADFLDVTLTVESAGVFKPDPRVYTLATAHYAVAAEQLLFVTSNGWDATGAAAFGMRVAWCNRAGNPAETFGPRPEWTLHSLKDLAVITSQSTP